VLLHPTSLPGDQGCGVLDGHAVRFLDFLKSAGMKYWQVCPLGPTGYGDSPYQSFSSCAGNPYFIDLGELVAAGLLTEAEVAPLGRLPAERVDYGALYHAFGPVLRQAHQRFAASGADEVAGLGSLAEFRRRHDEWLRPYGEFMALKEQFGGRAWTQWPLEFRAWSPALRDTMPAATRIEADRHVFYQYLFFAQWRRLRDYARAKGVGVIGDVPIFVAMDSADTWQHREVFQLSATGEPSVVAGVPPDYFSALGQLWGNPLYNWEHLARTHYTWWIGRFQSAFELYDIVRLDHFRGFDTFWEIPAGAPDARTGRWQCGPGLAFFKAVQQALPNARIIAEDLGYIGPDVVALRRAAGLPGMKILQFSFGHDANNANLPHLYPPGSVAYTGTHDNIPTRGWLESLPAEYAGAIRNYYQLNGSNSAWPMIRVALATVSRLAVIPVQDLLDLPASAALNRPGTADGNWQWRFTAPQLAGLREQRLATLREWIKLYDRTGRRPFRDYSEPLQP
jgi:4-alpha-glucanotransferase